MRYQNWDVLVFPEQSKIPQQEFKTSCQVVKDPEAHNLQARNVLLPTVTSFIPGLSAGEGFRISIHSWENPEPSQFILNTKRATDNIVFEARLFVDGKISGIRWFNSVGPWPAIIDETIAMNKNGHSEKLKFPAFHRELLAQDYWNAGDDLGRVKIVIAEGFAREHQPYPFERVRNVVSFSFQHAPLEVLETSTIAWPNAAMWRQVSLVGPYYAHASPPPASDAVEGHSHSPRHLPPKTIWPNTGLYSTNVGTMSSMPPPTTVFARPPTHDPFTGPVSAAFTTWHQRASDHSMPDYSSSSSNTRTASSRNISDPMQLVEKDRRPLTLSMEGAFESLCEGLLPPSNSPQTAGATPVAPSENRVPSISMAAATAPISEKLESKKASRGIMDEDKENERPVLGEIANI